MSGIGGGTAPFNHRLESVIGRSKIIFSEPLSLGEVEELFLYIARKLIPASPTHIDYGVYARKMSGRQFGDPNVFLERQVTSYHIEGTLYAGSPFTSASFTCKNQESFREEGPAPVEAIVFSTIPGYSLEEHQPEEVRLWDAVGREVDDYFAERAKKKQGRES